MLNYLKYFNLGMMSVMPAVIGLLMGTLLDRVFKVFPLFTVVFLFLGILSGLWSLYKSVKTLM
jgi:F0F1-type ATP synthase assembly protein I